MGEIKISVPSENLRFPYPVCKNMKSSASGHQATPWILPVAASKNIYALIVLELTFCIVIAHC